MVREKEGNEKSEKSAEVSEGVRKRFKQLQAENGIKVILTDERRESLFQEINPIIEKSFKEALLEIAEFDPRILSINIDHTASNAAGDAASLVDCHLISQVEFGLWYEKQRLDEKYFAHFEDKFHEDCMNHAVALEANSNS